MLPTRSTRFVEGFSDRKTLSNPRLVQHYRKSEINILVWFRTRGIGVDYIACFEREDLPGRPDIILNSDSRNKTVPISSALHYVPATVFEESSVSTDIQQPERCGDRSNSFVFVENVQLVQSPENRINSVVWVESLDYLFSLWREATYFGSKGLFSLGSLLRWINKGEASVRCDLRGKSADHVIQSASQVVECVPSGGGDIRRSADLDHAINQLTRLWITLGSEFVRVCVPEREELIFDFRDVLFGPFNLGLSAADLSRRHHMGS
jgi:hypothetical protein